jgi:chaperone modulatory protein CbpM
MKKLISITVSEMCEEYSIPQHFVEQFLLEEWVMPSNQAEMLFDDEDIARINLICELRNDLGVNDEAIPIILSLLDQLHHLRATVYKSIT